MWTGMNSYGAADKTDPGSTNPRRFAGFGSASRSHWAAFLLQRVPVSAADKSHHPIA